MPLRQYRFMTGHHWSTGALIILFQAMFSGTASTLSRVQQRKSYFSLRVHNTAQDTAPATAKCMASKEHIKDHSCRLEGTCSTSSLRKARFQQAFSSGSLLL